MVCYKMIADKLGVSYSTKFSYKNIYTNLWVSLGEAIAWYFKNIREYIEIFLHRNYNPTIRDFFVFGIL